MEDKITSLPDRASRRSGFMKDPAKRKVFILSLVILIAFAGLFLWKYIEIRNLRNEAQRDQEELRSSARNALVATHERHLKLLLKPLAWALRGELTRGNTDAVNELTNNLVRERNFQDIVVADTKGIIISATNKRFEKKPFSVIGKQEYMSSDSTMVDTNAEGLTFATSPIMGFDSRLGTLLVTYKIPVDSTFSQRPESLR